MPGYSLKLGGFLLTCLLLHDAQGIDQVASCSCEETTGQINTKIIISLAMERVKRQKFRMSLLNSDLK